MNCGRAEETPLWREGRMVFTDALRCCTLLHHQPELLPVDLLGDGCALVPDQRRDVLDRYAWFERTDTKLCRTSRGGPRLVLSVAGDDMGPFGPMYGLKLVVGTGWTGRCGDRRYEPDGCSGPSSVADAPLDGQRIMLGSTVRCGGRVVSRVSRQVHAGVRRTVFRACACDSALSGDGRTGARRPRGRSRRS